MENRKKRNRQNAKKMRSTFQYFWPHLADPMLPVAVLQEYKIEASDGQNPISLETLKKYLRVDGQHEDDLLLNILSAAIARVEKSRNVSLTGKHIHATYSYGQMKESYLPFSDSIDEMIECKIVNDKLHFEYTTSPTKDAEIQFEVFGVCKEMYDNRMNSNGKRIYI